MVCQVLGQKICLTMFYFLKPFWKVLGPGGWSPRPRGLVFLFIFRMKDKCLGERKGDLYCDKPTRLLQSQCLHPLL